MGQDGFLDKVYGVDGVAETRALYDAWSGSYDAEIGANGYATPGRIAAALAGLGGDQAAPLLDYGCGTGVSGAALRAAGFTTLDGADLSADMLAQARAKGLYRRLWQVDPDAPPGIAQGAYATITAVGVIGPGAGPIALFDTLMGCLAPGGHFALSFNDHALDDPAFPGRINDWVEAGKARLLVQDYGAHLPGQNLNAMIYVLEKT